MNGAVSLESKPLSRRVALANARRIVVIGCALGLLLFVGVHAGREFTSLFFQKSGQSQSGFDAPKAEGNALPRDPYREFLQTRIGHLLFASYRSENCRLRLFDNRTGESFEAGQVDCGQGPAQVKDGVDQQRVRRLLESFRK